MPSINDIAFQFLLCAFACIAVLAVLWFTPLPLLLWAALSIIPAYGALGFAWAAWSLWLGLGEVSSGLSSLHVNDGNKE